MKLSNLLILCICIFSFVSIHDAKSQDNLSQSLAAIKEKVQEVPVDKVIFKQSINILDEGKGKLSFVSVMVDDKGKTVNESFEFYVSDIDKNTIIRKISGKKLFISLTINNNQKFIKYFKEEKLFSYTNNIEILLPSSDEAQELINLFKATIPLVNSKEKGWDTNSDALNWLKENISKANSGTTIFEQAFTFGERKDYLANFTVTKTDQKGVATEEKYEFSLLDINNRNLTVKISGPQLSVSVETKGGDRYIKYWKNNELQSFDKRFDIIAEDIDQARNIVAAFSSAIEKSKSAMPNFANLQESTDFITNNITDVELDKKTVSQKIGFIAGNGTKSVFTSIETDSKGNNIEDRYEFYLNDIDVNSVNFNVSGKKITLTFYTKGKNKYFKYSKNDVLQGFQNKIDILTTDIETSRELIEAFSIAIKNSEIQPATWKTVNEAIDFLTQNIKGETIGTDVYELSFSAHSAAPLSAKYVQTKTDAKGIAVELSHEFYPYMLEGNSVKITPSGKFLSVDVVVNNKKSFIKISKDGVQQSYGNGIGIMAFDAKIAQDIAEAVKYIANTDKPKEMVWSDKQMAMNFITDNIGDLENEGKEVKQKLELVNGDPCKLSLTVTTIDNKGISTEEIYEFSLADINILMVDYKVKGKQVSVTLACKNKEKLIKVYKNGAQQAYGAEIEIIEKDIEVAKNVAEAFKSAITHCGK